MKTGTGRTCEVATYGLLGRKIGGRASGLAKQLSLLADRCEETQEQDLDIWEWNIQEQQAVVR